MKPKKTDFLALEQQLTLSKDALIRHDERLPAGLGVYNTRDGYTPGVEYRAVGLTYELYDDGTRTLCWMVYNNDGVLELKACSQFAALDPKPDAKEGLAITCCGEPMTSVSTRPTQDGWVGGFECADCGATAEVSYIEGR